MPGLYVLEVSAKVNNASVTIDGKKYEDVRYTATLSFEVSPVMAERHNGHSSHPSSAGAVLGLALFSRWPRLLWWVFFRTVERTFQTDAGAPR